MCFGGPPKPPPPPPPPPTPTTPEEVASAQPGGMAQGDTSKLTATGRKVARRRGRSSLRIPYYSGMGVSG